MKKILIVANTRLFPATTGGQLHTTFMAKVMGKLGYEVRVFALAGRREDYAQGKKCLDTQPVAGVREYVDLGLTYGLLQTVNRRIGGQRFWQFGLLKQGWVPSLLKEWLQWADVALADMPFIPPIPSAKKIPWYLISHNLEFKLLEQGNRQERLLAPFLEKIEAAAPQRYDDIFPVADEDYRFFQQHDRAGKCRLPMIGSGIDPEVYYPLHAQRAQTRASLGVADDEILFVFSGSQHAPNYLALDALKAFCRANEAALKAKRWRFLWLGSMESSAYQEGVMIATSRVPETPPYFAAADVGLNPVVTGSGANVKLFEYLAARLPVLSTVFGVRGTALQAGVDYTIYDPEQPWTGLEAAAARVGNATEAEAIWQRHRAICDINALVAAALSQLPSFAKAGATT
jgi:glycosyltransferase involved in cell wall biosynthesis